MPLLPHTSSFQGVLETEKNRKRQNNLEVVIVMQKVAAKQLQMETK
jgi:hypothetical protein